MAKQQRLLILEDSESDFLLLLNLIGSLFPSIDCKRVADVASWRLEIKNSAWDYVICDYLHPSCPGMATFEEWKELSGQGAFFYISRQVPDINVISALEAGVSDFIIKTELFRLPFSMKRERGGSARQAKHEAGRRADAKTEVSEALELAARLEDEIKKKEHMESMYSHIFHDSRTAVAVWDPGDGRIIDANEQFYGLFCTAETRPASVFEINTFGGKSGIETIMQELQGTGTITDRELRIDRHGKPPKFALASFGLIEARSGSHAVCMALDITKRKENEDNIAKALEKQKELNMLKTQFISMISHEFRTPLTTIMLSTDLLRRYGNSWTSDDKLKHFNRIQETVLRMTQLMENVLIIGRMDSGKLEFNADHIDLKAFCSTIAGNIEINAGGKNKINCICSAENIIQPLDENLLGLTLTNLLTNAVKFSPHGTDVDFVIDCNDDYASFRISDKGIGIPANDIPHLFESFFRGGNVGPIPGYGLGLAIVKKCIDSQFGTITIESTENEGTSVLVSIPVNPDLYKGKTARQTML